MDTSEFIFWILGAVFIPFMIAYPIASHFKHKVKTKFEMTWEKNRQDIISHSLTTIDNEINFMRNAFDYCEQNGMDFNKKNVDFTLSETNIINPNLITEQVKRLPGLANALGFIRFDQYFAITDYLDFSYALMESLKVGRYQKDYLRYRIEKAGKVLELFPDEIEKHKGLQEWKEYFDSVELKENKSSDNNKPNNSKTQSFPAIEIPIFIGAVVWGFIVPATLLPYCLDPTRSFTLGDIPFFRYFTAAIFV